MPNLQRPPVFAGSDEVYPGGSVGKALELLRLFDHPVKPVRIGQASRALRMPPSTVHRMLAMLQQYGYVRQNAATREYFAGAVLLDLARSLGQEPMIGDFALPEMQRLVNRTKETAFLAVMRGRFVQLVACVESPLELRVAAEVGLQFAATFAASGRARLATLSDDEVRHLYPTERVDLGDIRRRGYATQVRESDGAQVLARVVRVPPGNPPIAIAVTVPPSRIAAHRSLIVRELRRSAERMSARFTVPLN